MRDGEGGGTHLLVEHSGGLLLLCLRLLRLLLLRSVLPGGALGRGCLLLLGLNALLGQRLLLCRVLGLDLLRVLLVRLRWHARKTHRKKHERKQIKSTQRRGCFELTHEGAGWFFCLHGPRK